MKKVNTDRKEKEKIGYTREGESSNKGAQKNQRPIYNHYGKLGHTLNKCWSNGKEKFNEKCYSCNKHGHRASEYKGKPKFEGKCHNCKKQGHKYFEWKTKVLNLVEQIVKDIFG